MSRLLVLVRPDLATGFQLAGVDALAVEQPLAAERAIAGWLAAGQTGLLALQGDLLAGLSATLRARLEDSQDLLCVAIPGVAAEELTTVRRARLIEIIRQAIGVQVLFGDSPDQEPGQTEYGDK